MLNVYNTRINQFRLLLEDMMVTDVFLCKLYKYLKECYIYYGWFGNSNYDYMSSAVMIHY